MGKPPGYRRSALVQVSKIRFRPPNDLKAVDYVALSGIVGLKGFDALRFQFEHLPTQSGKAQRRRSRLYRDAREVPVMEAWIVSAGS